MPKTDFFSTSYVTEQPRRDVRFGVVDDGHLARTTVDDHESEWDAVVENQDGLLINFVAVDHNIEVRRSNGELESMCDALLWRERWVCFIEIKDRRDGWIAEAIEQLKSTITVFKLSHDWRTYRCREAYACNRHHGHFHASKMQEMNDFRTETGFRLNIVNTITAR